MNEVNQLWTGVLLILALLLVPVSYGYAHADANFKSGGDWGCKTAAKANVNNLKKDGNSFFGAGDYGYGCKDSTLKSMWTSVPSKQGAVGNHECEKHQNEKFVSDTFHVKCSSGAKMFIRGNSVAIFTINQFLKGSAADAQYKFVSDNVNKVSNQSNIIGIFFVFHELMYPVNCSGSHCHGLEKTSFKAKYEPLITEHNIIVIQSHTHLVAFGTINGVRSAVCGGGGEDGTSLNGNGAYTYVSNKMSFCYFHVQNDKVIVEQIDTTGKVIHTHSWGN